MNSMDFRKFVEMLWKHGITAWTLILAAMTLALRDAYYPQSPGICVGMLALVAGIMSVRELSVLEKITWVGVLVAFAVLEVNAIGRADADNAAVRNQQNQEFQQIAQDLQESMNVSKQQFGTTIQHVDGVLNETKSIASATGENLKQLNGGDSWGLVTLDPLRGTSTAPIYHLTISNSSKRYNLRNVTLRIIRLQPYPIAAYPQCNVGTISADYRGADVPESCVIEIRSGVENTFDLLMAADNGAFRETLKVSVDGKANTKVTKTLPNGKVKLLKDWDDPPARTSSQ